MENEYEQYGFVKLYRKYLDHPLMKRPNYRAVWVELLANAVFTDGIKVEFKGEVISLKKGQLTAGRDQIAKGCGVKPSTVCRILKCFQVEQLIEQQPSNKCTLITIPHLVDSTENGQQSEQLVNNSRTLNKNVKNENNKYNRRDDEKLATETEKKLVKWFSEKEEIENPQAYSRKVFGKFGEKVVKKAISNPSCDSIGKFYKLCNFYQEKQNGAS